MNCDNSDSRARRLIRGSAELGGAAVGGALGFLAGGPAGAAALGAAGFVATKVFEELGEEVSARLLGPREKQRIGGVLAIAAARIRERLERGDQIRDDGFFDKGATGRSSADEVVESVALTVQRDPEEKKLQYMGCLYSNVAFNSEISSQMAHQMIKAGEQMTYRQFCLLKIFGVNAIWSTLRNSHYRNQVSFPIELRQILYDCFALARNYYIVDKSYILGVTDLHPRNTRTQGLGADMFNLMELNMIPIDDLQPIVRQLS